MNTAGRVALTQATLSAIPVHLSIVVCLSPWAVMCRVAWEVVCRPKELGGLAIIDLRRFGLALRLRWDWVRKVDPNRTWIDLPSSSDKATRALFVQQP